MSLTEISIKRPSLIVVIFTIITLVGVFCYKQLSYELLPKITPPVITVVTVYPGASPTEIENSVTKKVEDAISSLNQIKRVNSNSSEGSSLVLVQFEQNADIDKMLQDAQRNVNQISSTLPTNCKAPQIFKFALDEIPVLQVGVTSNQEGRTFYQFVKDNVKPRLSTISGVGQVTLIGGEEREIRVNVDVNKLKTYNLSILQVINAVSSANLDVPTGNLKGENEQFVVRLAGKIQKVEDVRKLVVANLPNLGEVKLGDIAEVNDSRKDYSIINRINGVSSIGLSIQKQSGANAVNVSREVREALLKIEKDYPDKAIKFDVAQDTTTFTIEAADAVKVDLMFAIGLVALVMLLFLHSLRNSLIVMISIPASMVATFIGMYVMGFSLNLMTLLGLSLVVGILVDDSIVVLENIYRHLEMGKNPSEASLDGRNEIGFTALSITLVDVVVFLPLSLVGGMVGNIMREFALVVVFSTLMSLFVSFTITPMLASRFSKLNHLTNNTLMGRFGLLFESLFEGLKNSYSSLLRPSLTLWGKVVVFIVTTILFVGSLMLVGNGFIGAEFFSQEDRGEFSVLMETSPGTTLERSNAISLEVESKLMKMPEVAKVITKVGAASEGFLASNNPTETEFYVKLKPKKERKLTTNQVGNEIKRNLFTYPGVKGYVRPIGIFGSADEAPIQIAMRSTSREELNKAVKVVEEIMNTTDGAVDVKLSAKEANPEVRLTVDREKLSEYGMSISDIGIALRSALTGYDDSKFTDKDNVEYDMRIRLDNVDRSSLSDIENMSLLTPRGQTILFKQVASVEQSFGPTKLERMNRISSVKISCQVVGKAIGTVGGVMQEKIAAKIKEGSIPKSVSFDYLGQLENQSEGFGSMGIAMLAAIIFMYLIMVALYDSYLYPFVVMFSLPVALIGALLALALTMKSLSIFSILGLIMMTGLVAKNAILLVDFTNQLKEEGYSLVDAIVEAGRERLRPIIMTTLSMIIGMLPIALSTSAGGAWKTGLAWALIGGLSSSMLLTLVVVPCAYHTFDVVKNFFMSLFSKNKNKDLNQDFGANSSNKAQNNKAEAVISTTSYTE